MADTHRCAGTPFLNCSISVNCFYFLENSLSFLSSGSFQQNYQHYQQSFRISLRSESNSIPKSQSKESTVMILYIRVFGYGYYGRVEKTQNYGHSRRVNRSLPV